MLNIRISAVSYLNSVPFIDGLKNAEIFNKISLSLDNPAQCAEKLLNGQADVGLVPTAIIPLLNNPRIISKYCISATGPVSSVNLYSQVPLPEIQSITLDYQSKTSVNLTKVLAQNFWKINPIYLEAQPGFENTIQGHNAAVVIGDRTFSLKNKYPFEFDLSNEWYLATGKPFVFACWVAVNKIDDDILKALEHAFQQGINAIPMIVSKPEIKLKYPEVDVKKYLEDYIEYDFTTEKQEGMSLFFDYLEKLNL